MKGREMMKTNSNITEKFDMEQRERRDIARIGFFGRAKEYEVYVKTDDECQIPHVHVRDIYAETDTAICLQSNKYCKHQNKETHTFIYDFGELLLAFMKEPCRSPRYADNYEFAVSMWNINNQSECSWQKDEGGCSIIPDYRSMNTRIAKKTHSRLLRYNVDQ
jgi:hypothetical protein